MTTILDDILKEKVKEVQRLKDIGTVEPVSDTTVHSLYDSFINSDYLSVIGEVKRASPSKGDIDNRVNPVEQAKAYVEAGAKAISVLTDTPFFKGTMDDLAQIRKAVDVPILCKDFIIDPIQIRRAKAHGADVILLIASALPKDELVSLYNEARRNHLAVLFEVHNEEELTIALDMDVDIIGINNRNLKTFDVSLDVTERLAEKIRTEETLVISESGIKSKEDAKRVTRAGAKGILVGETLMKSKNIRGTLEEMVVPLRSDQG
ncbi:indole-3-glycerol phosphate synthase TrpC [Virgibacillus sp. MSP4-1]|uniref:indole-3-glycerol phosphate synthase TrpC n=1 Tax=Virgibacillus sp. MSP4-1 TaxID=2700081 RepID=UPI00039ED472|nr:indole-3-glycerol phosphate synthase TrpC [Virgibacillus sp. MSP4-1]QHS24308.1 indole-3-glycerol phosphate synthase TrpC [Virgibacillus sp. MSP4-1]